MFRIVFALFSGSVACAALAAPVPLPSPAFFKPGWDRPVDPDRDCKFRHTLERLRIEIPGKDHDLDPSRKRMNAPRLLRNVEGDYRVEVRVSGEWPLSERSASAGVPASVSGGLLIQEELGASRAIHLLRLEYGVRRKEGTLQPYIVHYTDVLLDGVSRGKNSIYYAPGTPVWPLLPGAKIAYLRIEREGAEVRVYFGPDGKKWVSVYGDNRVSMHPRQERLKVGLAACSTSTEPFQVQFDRFQLIAVPRGRKLPPAERSSR